MLLSKVHCSAEVLHSIAESCPSFPKENRSTNGVVHCCVGLPEDKLLWKIPLSLEII